MKAYINCKQTKAQAVAMMEEHRRLDHIEQGAYSRGEAETFKGCLVGCATHGDHDAFEPEFGIPWRVAWLADDIFEQLSHAESVDFAVDFFKAIPEGAGLSRVYDQWCAWMLADPTDGLTAISSEPSVAQMGSLFTRAAVGDEPTVEEWEEAAIAAIAAMIARDAMAPRIARDAMGTRSAENARVAMALSWVAMALSWVAMALSWVARDARIARIIWGTDAYAPKMRDKLLELLSTAPVEVL